VTPSPSDTPLPTDTPVPTETPLPTNSPPEISPIAAHTTDEDVPAGPITFTIGDVETPADALQVLAGSSNRALVPPANIITSGSGSNRNLTLIPASDQSGTTTITITVTDTSGYQASTSFELAVVAVNDAPVAQDDFASTVQDTPVSIPALANDSDVDSDGLQFSTLSDPAHGSVQSAADQLVYTPDPGYSGEDSFTYTLTDGDLESLPAAVTVTINPPD
jgi:hypothetical protein